MNADKKFKKAVENSGRALREKHSDFYSRMVNTYYSEPPKKKSPSFSLSKTLVTVLSACLILVVMLGTGIGIGLSGKKGPTNAEISVPKEARVVPEYRAEYDANELNVLYMSRARMETLEFGDVSLSLDADVEIYEDVKNEITNFYYVTSSVSSGFYRLTLIVNPDYQNNRVVDGETKTIVVKGTEFTYSVVYSQNEKMVYFFAEAKSGDQKLLVDYTTQNQECEKSFISFLNSIIL